jgi:hypothetical protein
MRTITPEQLVKAIAWDPAWARGLTEPLKVTGFVNLNNSKITHLSEFLIFDGANAFGEVASFKGCTGLQVPLGKYNGAVSFEESGVRWVPKESNLLQIKGMSSQGMAANFASCFQLEEAAGVFHGGVDFSGSALKTIGELKIFGHFKEAWGLSGFSASFYNCQNLDAASGDYEYPADFTASSVKTIEKLIIHKGTDINCGGLFVGCANLEYFHGTFPGFVNLDNSGIKYIKDITIKTPMNGILISIKGCNNLKSLPPQFTEKNTLCDKEILEFLKLKSHLKLKLEQEKNEQKTKDKTLLEI